MGEAGSSADRSTASSRGTATPSSGTRWDASSTATPIALHGLADAAVRRDWRSRGIAREMGARLHEEAIRRGAAAVIAHTGALGLVAGEHGMVAVQPGELFLRRRFRRPLPLVENWYLRWHTEPVVPLTIDGRV
jgi:GNAT superfamily N-acetyltransferase